MAGRFGYRGAAPALKPEGALKRADELLGVGQKQNALQTLHDTITNKRQQRNWNKALEQARVVDAGGSLGRAGRWGGRPSACHAADGMGQAQEAALILCSPNSRPQVMMKYVDICVDMKAGRKCKDALINYRNACQQVNVGSLEEVIKYLLQVASQRAEEASKAAEAKLENVEDLEAEASPEEMMLSYVSGEKSKDRTDRELVTPWFKFLWETYRCDPQGGAVAHCWGNWGRQKCSRTRAALRRLRRRRVHSKRCACGPVEQGSNA